MNVKRIVSARVSLWYAKGIRIRRAATAQNYGTAPIYPFYFQFKFFAPWRKVEEKTLDVGNLVAFFHKRVTPPFLGGPRRIANLCLLRCTRNGYWVTSELSKLRCDRLKS